MVGRFVQEQQLRVADQCLPHGHPALPAAGQPADSGRRVELQPRQHGFHLRVQAPAVHVLQLRLQGVKLRHQSPRSRCPARQPVWRWCGDSRRQPRPTAPRERVSACSTVWSALNSGSCGTSARRSAWARCTVPASGSRSPASSLSSVDLPLPLRPTSASRSPDSTCNAASSSRGNAVEGQGYLFQGKNCHRVSTHDIDVRDRVRKAGQICGRPCFLRMALMVARKPSSSVNCGL